MTARSNRPSSPPSESGSPFGSTRERWLWIWSAAVVVAIYSTVGLAQVLSEELRRRELLDVVFAAAFLLIIVAIVALGVRARPGGLEIGVLLGVVAVYALVFVRMAIPEERTHLVEFGVLAILLDEALVERARHRRVPWSPAVVALAVAIALGAVDELIQLFVPSRVFDVRDILTNTLACLLAVAAKRSLRWAGDRRHRSKP